ncbi:putative HNH endonuclease [Nitrincola phage 1M3-16]|uniref:HNH endonuclease n=1 Tax=Nitrincola phage 1M3-16 TaxID=1472912 RepID=UPI000444B3CF|nr:HNH endonuclease [Nitrincola phage 1M3-16]AHX01151.1 putative HNH endonuclease [Nitrincola phage 1M3-16]
MPKDSQEQFNKMLALYPDVWNSPAKLMSYLRGCLRSAWNKHPVKHIFIKKIRKQIKNPNPRGNKPTVWGFTCAMCKQDFPTSQLQVDHIEAAGQLNSLKDIQTFIERLFLVTEDDLRPVCKECNNALSLADRQGITYEQAIRRKKVIAFGKLSQYDQEAIVGKCKTKKERIQKYEEMLDQ